MMSNMPNILFWFGQFTTQCFWIWPFPYRHLWPRPRALADTCRKLPSTIAVAAIRPPLFTGLVELVKTKSWTITWSRIKEVKWVWTATQTQAEQSTLLENGTEVCEGLHPLPWTRLGLRFWNFIVSCLLLFHRLGNTHLAYKPAIVVIACTEVYNHCHNDYVISV